MRAGDATLPRMRRTGAAQNAAAIRAAPDRSRIRGRRLLYVDDDPRLRLLVARLLDEAGATCHPAGTHDAALDVLDRDPRLELAILDFHMPDGHVAQLVPRLRSLRPGLPLVGTSGMDRRTDFAECGVTRFIAKPWGLDDLLRAANW